MTNQRLLFVDDEPGIRATLPLILGQEGFDVSVAGNVPEALQFITTQPFDVLLTDLNIGNPGDGLTVVSAMRRTQPNAATFILTGYPDFQTALEAIRQQVDDYLTKPADIPTLVESLKSKLQQQRHIRQHPAKRVAAVMAENADRIIQEWLTMAKADAELGAARLSDQERIDHLPRVMRDLVQLLYGSNAHAGGDAFEAAAVHGVVRAAQGCTISMLVRESGILHSVLSRVLQECMLELDLSMVVGDAMNIGEHLNALLAQSIRAFEDARARRRD